LIQCGFVNTLLCVALNTLTWLTHKSNERTGGRWTDGWTCVRLDRLMDGFS